MTSLVVKMLNALVSKTQVFLLKKNVKCKSYSHFFSKNISIFAIFNDQSFNNMLTNNIVNFEQLGPVVQRVVSLTSSLRVISLTVLADSIHNILIVFAEKMWVALHCKSYSHFFSKKFQHICVSLDVNFNESLTNDIVSFEQLGPGVYTTDHSKAVVLVLFVFCGDFWLLAMRIFSCFPCLLSCCVWRILSSIVINLLGKRKLVALHFHSLWLVYCLSEFVCSSSLSQW